MSDAIIHVSDSSFSQDVLQSSQPVLLDFWAEWCGPCKALAPILEDVATQYAGRLTVAKIDTEANREVPTQFGIRGIPTLILFKDGKAIASTVGSMKKNQLTEFLDKHL